MRCVDASPSLISEVNESPWLLRYRVTGNVALPFRLVPALQESGKSKLTITLKATANFDSTKFASDVVIKFPVRFACDRGR
jgi:hypothetical protein